MKKQRYVKKSITILEEDDEWVINNSINLSRLVQKLIADLRTKKSKVNNVI